MSDRIKYRLLIATAILAFGICGLMLYGYATHDWRLVRLVTRLPKKLLGGEPDKPTLKPTVSYMDAFSVGPSPTIIVSASNADLRVVRYNQPLTTVDAWYLGDTTKRERFDVSVESVGGDTLRISVRPTGDYAPGKAGRARVIVSVPGLDALNANLEIGFASIEGLSGSITIATNRGNILATDAAGTLKLLTLSGDVVLERCSASGEVETRGGEVKADYYLGDLKIASTADITLKNHIGNIRARTRRGNVRANFIDLAPSGDILADSGNVSLRLLPGARTSLDLQAPSSTITNTLELDSIPATRTPDPTRLRTTMNGGGGTMMVRSLLGKVALERFGDQ